MIIVVRDALTKEVCDLMSIEFSMMRDAVKTLDPYNDCFDHPSVGKNTFSWYSPIGFESLMEYLRPTIEEVVGDHLYSTYSYGRIYNHNSELKPHTDRDSSEISVSCCLKKDSDWSLNFEGSSVDLNVGDICIFPGSEITHWRDKYNGQEYIGAFLQYVRASGERSYLKWDTRPRLATPLKPS